MKTKYWMEPDWFCSRFWTIYKKVWWWPWKIEVGNGIMDKEEAEEKLKFLRKQQDENFLS